MTSSRTVFGILELLTISALLAGSFFLAFPGFDMVVSGHFADTTGFRLIHSPSVQFARSTAIGLSNGPIVVAISLLMFSAILRRKIILKPRVLVFAIVSFALVPGLLVNGILKRQSGRARPRDIDVFGGDAAFTPVLQFADQCRTNCSFVSAEASALFTLTAILLLIFLPCLPSRLRTLSCSIYRYSQGRKSLVR